MSGSSVVIPLATSCAKTVLLLLSLSVHQTCIEAYNVKRSEVKQVSKQETMHSRCVCILPYKLNSLGAQRHMGQATYHSTHEDMIMVDTAATNAQKQAAVKKNHNVAVLTLKIPGQGLPGTDALRLGQCTVCSEHGGICNLGASSCLLAS